MRAILALFAVAFLGVVLDDEAQAGDQPANVTFASAAMSAAFDCAALAGQLLSSDGFAEDQRLMAYGVTEGRIYASYLMSQPHDPDYALANVNPDFWVGVSLGQADDQMLALIQSKLPADPSDQSFGTPTERSAVRVQVARAEFDQRNCALLGRDQ